MTNKILIFLFYIISSSFGLFFMKKSTGIMTLNFVFGNALYIVGYVIWVLIILKMLPLSTAFPLASAGLIITSQIIGFLFLEERINIYNILGCCLIFLGFVVIFIKGDFR